TAKSCIARKSRPWGYSSSRAGTPGLTCARFHWRQESWSTAHRTSTWWQRESALLGRALPFSYRSISADSGIYLLRQPCAVDSELSSILQSSTLPVAAEPSRTQRRSERQGGSVAGACPRRETAWLQSCARSVTTFSRSATTSANRRILLSSTFRPRTSQL